MKVIQPGSTIEPRWVGTQFKCPACFCLWEIEADKEAFEKSDEKAGYLYCACPNCGKEVRTLSK
jgi:predicted RNA-binding Zn-ribbon protein involved in translation (DUF1610 family)